MMSIRGTKTEASAADIPLTPLAHRELTAWWERCERPGAGLVFPARAGGAYGDQGWRKALQTAARRAGLNRRIYPYLFRDSFATIAWSVGLEMDVARRVLRHTDETMLRDVYCRPRPSELVDRVRAFDWS